MLVKATLQNTTDTTLQEKFDAAKIIMLQIPLSDIAENGFSEIGWAAEQEKLFDEDTQWFSYCFAGVYISDPLTKPTPILFYQCKVFSNTNDRLIDHLPIGWEANRDPLDDDDDDE